VIVMCGYQLMCRVTLSLLSVAGHPLVISSIHWTLDVLTYSGPFSQLEWECLLVQLPIIHQLIQVSLDVVLFDLCIHHEFYK